MYRNGVLVNMVNLRCYRYYSLSNKIFYWKLGFKSTYSVIDIICSTVSQAFIFLHELNNNEDILIIFTTDLLCFLRNGLSLWKILEMASILLTLSHTLHNATDSIHTKLLTEL